MILRIGIRFNYKCTNRLLDFLGLCFLFLQVLCHLWAVLRLVICIEFATEEAAIVLNEILALCICEFCPARCRFRPIAGSCRSTAAVGGRAAKTRGRGGCLAFKSLAEVEVSCNVAGTL